MSKNHTIKAYRGHGGNAPFILVLASDIGALCYGHFTMRKEFLVLTGQQEIQYTSQPLWKWVRRKILPDKN
jgi:hypothetical protein